MQCFKPGSRDFESPVYSWFHHSGKDLARSLRYFPGAGPDNSSGPSVWMQVEASHRGARPAAESHQAPERRLGLLAMPRQGGMPKIVGMQVDPELGDGSFPGAA